MLPSISLRSLYRDVESLFDKWLMENLNNLTHTDEYLYKDKYIIQKLPANYCTFHLIHF